MPKIDAPTVREHHEIVKARLVAATERILRESGPEALSAGAVARAAGIARNSIYRYVDSVDDLRLLTLARYLPLWRDAVFRRVDSQAEPVERLAQFAASCVMQTREQTHGRLMSLMRHSSTKKRTPKSNGKGKGGGGRGCAEGPRNRENQAAIRNDVANVHAMVDEFMAEQWAAIGVEAPDMWTGFSRALLFEAFTQVERGADAEDVATQLGHAIRGMAGAANRA